MESGLWPSVISALIVGVITLLGVYETIHGQEKGDERRRKDTNKAVKRALRQELDTIWKDLSESVESFWEEYEQRKFLDFRSFLSRDYLTIYRSNADHIGHIDDPELRDNIVKVYLRLQFLIDAYNLNTEFLKEYLKAEDSYKEATVKGAHQATQRSPQHMIQYAAEAAGFEASMDKALRQLKRYAPDLKEQHEDFADLIGELLDMLEKDISVELTKPKWPWEQ